MTWRWIIYALFMFWQIVGLTGYAKADQIDYILAWSSKTAARADADALADHNGEWAADHAMEIQGWRASQDTTDAQGDIVHNFLTGYYVVISTRVPRPALFNNSNVVLVLDRDQCSIGRAGCVLKRTITPAVLQDIRIAPIYQGANYPFGSLQ